MKPTKWINLQAKRAEVKGLEDKKAKLIEEIEYLQGKKEMVQEEIDYIKHRDY